HPQGHSLANGEALAIMFFLPSVPRGGQAPPARFHQGDGNNPGGVRFGGASDMLVGWKVGRRGSVISFDFNHCSRQGLAIGKNSGLKDHAGLETVWPGERRQLHAFSERGIPSLLRLHVKYDLDGIQKEFVIFFHPNWGAVESKDKIAALFGNELELKGPNLLAVRTREGYLFQSLGEI